MADLSTPGARPPGHVLGSGHGLPVGRALAVLAVFVVAAVLLLSLVHPTSSSNGATGPSTPAGAPPAGTGSTTTTTTAPPTTTTTTTPPGAVTVVVANASNVNGVAAKATQELTPGGWKLLTPTNAATEVATSAVYYAAGYQPSATAVASTLHVPASAVAPLTSSVPVSGVSSAQVVVVIGTDLAASLNGTSTTTTTTKPGATTTTTKASHTAH